MYGNWSEKTNLSEGFASAALKIRVGKAWGMLQDVMDGSAKARGEEVPINLIRLNLQIQLQV
jgi:hypothetical protein